MGWSMDMSGGGGTEHGHGLTSDKCNNNVDTICSEQYQIASCTLI